MRFSFALIIVSSALATAAVAQYPHNNIELYKHYTLESLGAGSGNSCWGYVSPSGREYAIMGLNNKTAFVEITDPNNTSFFAEIPHSSGLWSDVKVYKNALYVVTENSGSGVQVIDLSNIDNHSVTLVKTITEPGRSHTINVDPDSGFLYNVGTNEGTGTTMCFDLTDPLNPVRVGSNSLTGGNYIHECQVVTYKTGAYAGRQIMFGGGTQRGFEIYDVTNKNAVTLVKRVVYPFVGYCHQGWLSADRKYFYVNDEFDEFQQTINVRTLVFDVSVLETADLVATYSNDRPTIDHNIYTKNGFIFHSDYSSGFWVFDGNADPRNPTAKGFFDTFPSDDRRDYVGTWSNYVDFPSGTCIISDINDGLFIVDVSEATKTTMAVGNVMAVRGNVLGGGVADVQTQNSAYYVVGRGFVANANEAPIQVVFEGTCLWQDISKLQFNVRHKVNSVNLQQTIELYDWVSNTWVLPSVAAAPLSDTTFTVTGTNPDRFVEPVTKRMKARLSIKKNGFVQTLNFKTSVDLANWVINP